MPLPFNVSRRLSARRKAKQALGIRGLGSLLPNLPSAREIISRIIRRLLRSKSPKLRHYRRVMKLKDVSRLYKPMHMEIVKKSMNATITSGLIGLLNQLCEAAPVKTGTLVANFSLTPTRTTFKQYAGFFPRVVAGTDDEEKARRRPVNRAYEKYRWLVTRSRSLRIMNPTPYYDRVPFYTDGVESMIKRDGIRTLNNLLKKEMAKTVVKMARTGRV